MHKNIEWAEIARYVSGNSSIEESKRLKNKMESDETYKKLVEEARMAWNISGKKAGAWNMDKAWDDVRQRLEDMDEMEATGKSRTVNKMKSRPNKRSLNYMIRVAAVVVISAATGILLYRPDVTTSSKPQQEQVQKELVAKKGEQKRFQLSDGTLITLAADSKIRLSPQYQAGSREVYLEGEAFFDVASNPDRPFKVHVGETTTEVVGTQFNIIFYPGDEDVRVVVVEGSVGLQAHESDKQVLIKPGELGKYSADHLLTVQKVNLNNYTGWMDGKLVFDNQPLSKVVIRLERWYGLSFNIEDTAIKERKLTAAFNLRQPLEEVLDAIAISLDLTYVKNDRSFTFQQ
ncbi:FecR family protein [Gracilimonas sediminicola]|uniref:FecR family protein n=1 Tax=Gracilimonas sediminicola TaxID=2952158 RepID=UPI0038D3BFC6